MIKATKKDSGSFIYMRLKKHPCPECGEIMKVVKIKKTVKAKSKEASSFDFSAANVKLAEKVKFIWFEFKCPKCGEMYKEEALKKLEREKKREARSEK